MSDRSTQQSTWQTALVATSREAFAWHERPGALQRLLPPWERVEVERSATHIRVGAEVVLRMRLGPLSLRWHARHTGYEPPSAFVDESVSGPFAIWRHRHTFEATDLGSILRDTVDWRLPIATLAQPLVGAMVRKRLDAMFAFRHRRTKEDVNRHARWGSTSPLRIAVTGSTGMVGRNLVAFLRTGGHHVTRLVRSHAALNSDTQDDTLLWKLDQPELSALSGYDAVVHLAGAPIAAGRWTAERKRAIAESRDGPTRRLAEALAALPEPPKVFVSASAIGFYGDRDAPVDEGDAPGSGFLAEVCQRWETAAKPAAAAGIRVVHPRIGVVLDPSGGALAKMLPVWRLGLGGPLGHGRQPVSWISLDDLLAVILFAITREDLEGPVNAVAPQPVTNAALSAAIGGAVRRPALIRTPVFAVRAAFGEMADATLLGGAPVMPSALTNAGFAWDHSDLQDTLRFVLGTAAK